MARIAVESTLTDVKQALSEMGHEVVDLRTEQDASNCDCCVVSGQDNNVMGIQTTTIAGPVINADGQNANQICDMVDQKLS